MAVHVVPDSVIPSSKTQRRISNTYGTISRLVKPKKKKKAVKSPARASRSGSAKPSTSARRSGVMVASLPGWLPGVRDTNNFGSRPPRPATPKRPKKFDKNGWLRGGGILSSGGFDSFDGPPLRPSSRPSSGSGGAASSATRSASTPRNRLRDQLRIAYSSARTIREMDMEGGMIPSVILGATRRREWSRHKSKQRRA